MRNHTYEGPCLSLFLLLAAGIRLSLLASVETYEQAIQEIVRPFQRRAHPHFGQTCGPLVPVMSFNYSIMHVNDLPILNFGWVSGRPSAGSDHGRAKPRAPKGNSMRDNSILRITSNPVRHLT